MAKASKVALEAIAQVGYESENLYDDAHALAQQLAFRLDKDNASCLYLTAQRLALKIPTLNLLFTDFSKNAWNKRKAEGKNQGLVRACKPQVGVKIVDATAGWGRDAAILAALGAQVVMIERHPVMAALLADALARRECAEEGGLNLSLMHENAQTYLQRLSEEDYPDVIYIDPMHPQRTKSALVKKEMYVLQEMIGPDDDALELLQLALTRTKQKVVVKWPQKCKPLLKTHANIPGKTIRYDIYQAR